MTTLAKGSIITATVEDALDNCIMVYVIHGSRTFRGVLLDEKNPLISRTPTREGVEKTRETSDITPQERTSMVVLQTSPRRTANSRKSGLSHRLVLLNQQEGKSSELRTVDIVPMEDADRSKKPKVPQKRKQGIKKPLKTAKQSASKPKTKASTQTTARVKRKTVNEEGYTRPLKKTKGMQPVYSQGEKLSSENKTREGTYMKGVQSTIVLQSCLVKVCPLTKSPDILNQSCTSTGEQTISAPRSLLNSIIEERIARQLKSEGQNTNTQTVAEIPEIRKLSFDQERYTHVDGVYDTASVQDEKRDTVTRTTCIDNDTASEIVDILGEETDSATSVIDDVTFQTANVISNEKTDTLSILNHDNTTGNDTVSELVDILGEETDSATSVTENVATYETVAILSEKTDTVEVTDATRAVLNHVETVDILSEQIGADTIGNELNRSESNFGGKTVVDVTEISANSVKENTCPVTSTTAHDRHDELSIYQNTPQSSDNDMPQKLYDRSINISTDTEDLQMPTMQIATVNKWEADIDVGGNGAAFMELPKHNMQQRGGDSHDAGLASSEHFKLVPPSSSDSEQHSNCSEISSTRLSIVVKLQPVNMKRREANVAQKPTTQSDAGHKSPRISVEDIVWGKVHGQGWWPAKVLSLSGTIDEVGRMSAKDASVAWFGCNTSSAIPVTRLSPFVTKFHKRHSPGKQGHYRIAVKEAMQAVTHKGLLSQHLT